ncbi:bifunctional precorrin-2 dehydrogenase/sirohydrochlorin ferrochelatase [Chloroflexota bacterium]
MNREQQETIYYPVSLNLNGRKCLVVGGGQVALRKVLSLLHHGAIIQLISPELCPELEDMAKKNEITVVAREYHPEDSDGAFMAIIATNNSKINREIANEARKRLVLVNVVDDADYCDFIAPSYIRRGSISITISTSGKSPALARKLRIKLEKEFGEEYAKLAYLLSDIRSEILEHNLNISGEDWQEAIDLDLLIELLKNGEEGKARTAILGKLKAKQQLEN